MLLFAFTGWKLLTLLAITGILVAFFNKKSAIWRCILVGFIISMSARFYCFVSNKQLIRDFSQKTITVCTLFGSTVDLIKSAGVKKRILKQGGGKEVTQHVNFD